MTQMTLVDVANIVYPGQSSLGNITFGQETPSGPIFITSWNVPDVPEPTVESLQGMIPSLQNQFDLQYFCDIGSTLINGYLDEIARERKYNTAVSCASYVNSTNSEWNEEAKAFIAWRDAIFVYTIQQIDLMKKGQRSIPSFNEFKMELPRIVWP